MSENQLDSKIVTVDVPTKEEMLESNKKFPGKTKYISEKQYLHLVKARKAKQEKKAVKNFRRR